MISFMGNLAFCICENKGAENLSDNQPAEQRLCFRYIGSSTPQIPNVIVKFQASSHLLWLNSMFCYGPDWKPIHVISLKRESGRFSVISGRLFKNV